MSEQGHTNFIMTGFDLKKLQVVPSEWTVEGLLRQGRRRISLLAGRPEDGKSTIALQLAVAVTKGQPFLGRRTARSSVIYWQSEDDAADVRDRLERLGYDPTADEELLVFSGEASENTLANLHHTLETHPNVALVVVETLDDLLKIDGLNENSAARKAFDDFHETIVDKFYHRTAFVALHHLRKNEADSDGQMLLGASVIRARTDAKWYIRALADGSDRRVFSATVRTGRPIPKTILVFDPEKLTSTLGPTVAEDKKMQIDRTEERIKTAILEYFEAHAHTTFEKDCCPAVRGNTDAKRRAFKKLERQGYLVKDQGTGSKGKPATYHTEIPTEIRERAA